MEWGAVQKWTNCCTDFVPKIMLAWFLIYAEQECTEQIGKPKVSVQEKNVEMMKAISTAILDDASSTSTNSFLQYTMSQCFKKVTKATRVYSSPDRAEVVKYHQEVFGEFGSPCFVEIVNAAESLEEAANQR